MYKQFIKHEHTPLLPYFLPGTNPDTDFGFYINHVNHLIFGVSGYSSFVGFELIVQMLKNATWVQTVAISYNLEELQSVIAKLSAKNIELKWRVREIMAKVTDSDNFLVQFVDLYHWKFFLQPLLLALSVGIGLFLFLVVISINYRKTI